MLTGLGDRPNWFPIFIPLQLFLLAGKHGIELCLFEEAASGLGLLAVVTGEFEVHVCVCVGRGSGRGFGGKKR